MTCSAFLLAATALFSVADDSIVPARVRPATSAAPEAVLFDTTHGTTLWAVGANYKAGFARASKRSTVSSSRASRRRRASTGPWSAASSIRVEN